MHSDFSRIKQLKMDEGDQVALILRNREVDRRARDFLGRHPAAVVVHIGCCGLDSRFERVDNGIVEWYDLDLPEVIDLRRKLIGGEVERYHLLACSVFDKAWLNAVSVHRPRPILFLAEGVLMYFEEAQVRSLVLALKEHFPGAEFVCDAFSPFNIWVSGARYCWGLKHGQNLERWGEGIRLLDEWFPLSHPEPRLAGYRWVRFIPLFARVMGVFHYRLGETPQ